MTNCSENIDDMKNFGVEATTTGTDCHKSKVCELKSQIRTELMSCR